MQLTMMRSLVLLVLGVVLTACGGGSGGDSSTPPVQPAVPSLTSIDITPNTTALPAGASLAFTAMGNYDDGSSENVTSKVTWSSTDTTVATIDPVSGEITAGATPGMSTIIHAESGTVVGEAILTVTDAVLLRITVDPNNVSTPEGFKRPYTATGHYSNGNALPLTDATWVSSVPTVATVDVTGVVTGVGTGVSTITASKDSLSGSADLTVTNATLLDISITPGSSVIPKGTKQRFKAIGTFSNGDVYSLNFAVSWVSADTTIVAINPLILNPPGVFKGVGVGTTRIRAELGTLRSNPADITITNATLQSISVTPENSTYVAGSKPHFQAMGQYSDNTVVDITDSVSWTSDDTNVATVLTNSLGIPTMSGVAARTSVVVDPGLATCKATGTTTIRAKKDGVEGNTTLHVTNPSLQSIAITTSSASVIDGQTLQLTATGTYTDGSTADITDSAVWGVDNISIASVYKGKVTGLSVGTVTVTASVGSGGTAYDTVILEVTSSSLPGPTPGPAPGPTPGPTPVDPPEITWVIP